MIRLLVKFEGESREVELADPVVTLGRSSENLVALADKKASRKHAKIEKTDAGYVLTDLESGNGTRVNGKDVKTYVLAKGDEIQIGLTSLFVLDLDVPAAVPTAAPATPPPAASPTPAAPAAPAAPPASSAPAAPPPAEKPAVPEIKRRITHRAVSSRSAAPGRTVAVAAIFIILGAVAYAFVFHHNEILPQPIASPAHRVAAAAKAEPSRAEAEKALEELRAKAAAGPVTDALLREAEAQAERFEAVLPGFSALRDDLKRRRAEDIAKMTFAEVERLVQEHLQNHRYGEAINALKALAGSREAEAASALLERITAQVRADREAVDETGKRLVEAKRYSEAAEHYRKNAPRFRGTEHYSYLSGKPERLMLLAEAETAAAKARTEKPAAAPAPVPAAKPVEEPVAKAMPAPEPPKPAMKPEPMKPAAPAMKPPEPPKPEPMKPEPMKPPAPKPEPPKPEPAKAEKARVAFKKPPVLCDIKRTVKGMFCTTCDRVLDPENDMRRGVCKRCEEKPMKIDMCVRRYFQASCHPEKISDKPVFCCGKLHDTPLEDRARIVYYCESCEQAGDTQGELPHAADCKNRFGVTKVCTKSGHEPHTGK